ncbi:MAG: MmgE/PrpD family protein [Rhodovibrionaceae bacterium]
MNLAKDFCGLLDAWSPRSEEIDPRCQALILDGLAVMMAGTVEPSPTILATQAQEDGGAPLATVAGFNFATAPAAAARVNAAAMHVLDFEPMWSPPNHAISTILPALIALAELREVQGAPPQGRMLFDALAKGIEAQGRLRLASKQIEPRQLTLHPPGIVGPLAAAVACAALLELGAEGMSSAIGIAASRTGGVLANVGSMTKALHCGDAAAHGLEAALLAQKGFSCGSAPFDGPHGYFQSYFREDFDPEPLFAPISPSRIVSPGPSWKLFPSQFATHFAISAAIALHRKVADPITIESVTLRVPSMPYIDRPAPTSGLDGKFSWQYTAAVALLDGYVGIESFSQRRWASPDLRNLLQRIRVVPDRSISGRFDEMYVDVTVISADGSTHSETCVSPLGSWSNPAEPSVINAKAQSLLKQAASPGAGDTVESLLRRDAGCFSVRELMEPLRGRASPP